MTSEKDIFERIQEYLRDKMSDEDRAAFERDLAADTLLRQQYEDMSLLASSIKKANIEAEADLRILLEETEAQIARAPMRLNDPTLEAELNQVEKELRMMGLPVDEPKRKSIQGIKKQISRFFSSLAQWFIPSGIVSAQSSEGNTVVVSLPYASRMAISFAVAASLTLSIILPYNHIVGMSGYNYAPSYIELPVLRGTTSDLLEKAINSYNNGDYGQSNSYLEEAQNALESVLSHLGDNDSDVIAKHELSSELYQVEWYRALSLMKGKKVKEAKRLLSSIAESDSPYARDAVYVLESVY